MADASSPKRKPRASYDDIVALPEGIVGEIIDGELVTHPRPAPRHAWSSTTLTHFIVGPFGLGINGPGGWVILDEPEIQFAAHTLVPDLAGWRKERMPNLPEKGPLEIAPDWVCEVLSPSTEQVDRQRKLRIYGEHHVGHAWLLDPIARTLEIFRLEATTWLLAATHGGDDVVRAEPFDAIELRLSQVWGEAARDAC
jgi:Uma2 family endonuclease